MNYLANWKRIALAMGMPEETLTAEMVIEWRKRDQNLIKPVLVHHRTLQRKYRQGRGC